MPASDLLPSEDMNEVAELQNCIIVCRKLFEAAVTASNTRGLDERQIKALAKVILIDTSRTLIEKGLAWGRREKIS